MESMEKEGAAQNQREAEDIHPKKKRSRGYK
jgi:hypothetical protein